MKTKKTTVKKPTKKAPKKAEEKSLYIRQAEVSPEGHRMSISLGLAGIHVDINCSYYP